MPNFRLTPIMLAAALVQVGCVAPPVALPSSEPIVGTLFNGGDYSPAGKAGSAVSMGGSAAGANPVPSSPSADDERSLQPRIIRGTDRVVAPARRIAPITGPANQFRFEDAPVAEVANVVLRDIVGVDYVLHPPLNGTVTLATKGRVSADEAMTLLESALYANGMLLARDTRGVYHVGRPEALKGVVAAPRQVGNGALPPGYGAVIVPLKYIGANEMAAILKPLLPAEALVRADTVRNLLVLVGTRSQAEGWLDLVNTFDVDLLKGMSVGVFPLKYASVREMQEALRVVIGNADGSPGATGLPAGAAAAPPPSAAGQPEPSNALPLPAALNGALRIVPIERLNSILVVTPRASYLDTAREWIERLDQPNGNSKEPELRVYAVQNGSAQHLAEVLSGLFGGAGAQGAAGGTGIAPGLDAGSLNSAGGMGLGGAAGGLGYAGGGAGGFGGVGGFGGGTLGGGAFGGAALNRPFAATGGAVQAGAAQQSAGVTAVNLGSGARVIADKLNNVVLVYSTAAEYRKIQTVLQRLDVPATQVLIEASIIEVTLIDELNYGLEWAFSDNPGNGTTGRGVLSTVAGGVLGGAGAGFSYTLKNSLGDVRAVLNLLATKTQVKVISSPSLLVLDNHTATIGVGDQVPIVSSTTITTGGLATSSVQYKDTGVQLAVTPSVTSGNVVTMQLNQAVTDVSAASATAQPTFLQRQINSKIAVRSGETVVLGGLIRERETVGKSGIPGLHDLPLVGSLFGTTNSDGRRTELLVIITPRVVRSDQEARDVGREMRDRMKGFKAIEDRALLRQQPLVISDQPTA
ncbi:MAG: type II secretion system secretin GspD, partial [Burkholderiaceae bacterium]